MQKLVAKLKAEDIRLYGLYLLTGLFLYNMKITDNLSNSDTIWNGIFYKYSHGNYPQPFAFIRGVSACSKNFKYKVIVMADCRRCITDYLTNSREHADILLLFRYVYAKLSIGSSGSVFYGIPKAFCNRIDSLHDVFSCYISSIYRCYNGSLYHMSCRDDM